MWEQSKILWLYFLEQARGGRKSENEETKKDNKKKIKEIKYKFNKALMMLKFYIIGVFVYVLKYKSNFFIINYQTIEKCKKMLYNIQNFWE